MSYELVYDFTQTNFRSGRRAPITYITMHDTGNRTDTAKGNANYFRSTYRGASAHYFVDDNFVYQVVREGDTSWHCGDGNGAYGITNDNSIGIELCRTNNRISPETWANAISLVKELMEKYDIDINHVVRHYDASRKLCPEALSANNWAEWKRFKQDLASANGIEKADPVISEPVKTESGSYCPRIYSNGSTIEPVYKDSDCTDRIGSLDRYEQATCIYDWEGKAIVLYSVNGTSNEKVGFVKWRGGINNPDKGYNTRLYSNGSTPETVYKDSDCTQKIGSLNPYEQATCIYEWEGKAVVLYKVDGTSNEKVGFVRWTGGIK